MIIAFLQHHLLGLSTTAAKCIISYISGLSYGNVSQAFSSKAVYFTQDSSNSGNNQFKIMNCNINFNQWLNVYTKINLISFLFLVLILDSSYMCGWCYTRICINYCFWPRKTVIKWSIFKTLISYCHHYLYMKI